MQQTLRPYVAAGVALVGAGMVAVAPMAATLPGLSAHNVALTTGTGLPDIDFTGAWKDAFDTAKTNSEALSAASTQVSQELFEAIKANPDVLFEHGKEIGEGLTFLGGSDLEGADYTAYLKGTVDPIAKHTLDTMHNLIYQVLNGTAIKFIADMAGIDPLEGDQLTLLNFAASPISGVLIGALGPSISPIVSALNSFDAIQGDLSGADGATPDFAAALQELVNLPANMVNGFLNGSTLDLSGLLPLISEAGVLPEGMDVEGLSYAFGGLFSTGSVNGLHDDIGGSLLNGLGINVPGLPLGLGDIDGEGIGPIGALVGMEDILAGLINQLGDAA